MFVETAQDISVVLTTQPHLITAEIIVILSLGFLICGVFLSFFPGAQIGWVDLCRGYVTL